MITNVTEFIFLVFPFLKHIYVGVSISVRKERFLNGQLTPRDPQASLAVRGEQKFLSYAKRCLTNEKVKTMSIPHDVGIGFKFTFFIIINETFSYEIYSFLVKIRFLLHKPREVQFRIENFGSGPAKRICLVLIGLTNRLANSDNSPEHIMIGSEP